MVERAFDLHWLARNCANRFDSVSIPSRQKLAGMQSMLDKDGEAAIPRILDVLFDTMGMGKLEWGRRIRQDALPVMAIIPGLGIRIVYGVTSQGLWLAEGAEGSHKIHVLPDNSRFSSLSAPSKLATKKTAYELFKSALKARKTIFMQAALASLLINSLAVATSLYTMQVYDRVIPTQGISTLTVLTIGVGITITLELLTKLARSIILEKSVKGMDLELSNEIFVRLLGVRMDQFPASVGTLSAQVRSYETIRTFISSATLYIAVDAPFSLLFVSVIYMLAGPTLAMIPAIAFIVSLNVGLFFRKRIASHAETGSAASNKKVGLLVETVESAEQVKANGSNWQALNQWDRLSRESVDDDIKIRHYSESASYFAASIQQVSYVTLVATGAWIASTTSDLTMGGLIACSILSGRVMAPVAALPGLIVQWAHSKVALNNLEKIFALEGDNHSVTRPLTPDTVYGTYIMEGVKFTYPERPTVLNIPQLEIKPGEKVAFLGSIGAGKSTLLKVLAGIYMPQEGRVLFDGIEMQQLSRSYISDNIGYFPQDIRLFSGTLRDNLLSGLYGISEEGLLEAVKKSGLGRLIASHPKGLDMDIAEGGRGVSGGQKQLIALTRLFIANPTVWLLDEPTASMDDHTEYHTLNLLKRSLGRRNTLILVTHKQTLLQLVDRVVVLTPQGIALDGPRDAVLQQLTENTRRAADTETSQQLAITAGDQATGALPAPQVAGK